MIIKSHKIDYLPLGTTSQRITKSKNIQKKKKKSCFDGFRILCYQSVGALENIKIETYLSIKMVGLNNEETCGNEDIGERIEYAKEDVFC